MVAEERYRHSPHQRSLSFRSDYKAHLSAQA
jgi:hypothetical protein